jgi:hypothetical protein
MMVYQLFGQLYEDRFKLSVSLFAERIKFIECIVIDDLSRL